jgi:hypothetical protein
VHIEHVLQESHGLDDQVVAEQDREGLVAHVPLGRRDGVPEAQRVALTDVVDRGHVRDLSDLLELVELALGLQEVLELERPVEVVDDRVLAPAGDDDDVGQAGPNGLLDHVLDGRLVQQRQHLLGLRLGRRKEAGP